MSKVIDALRQLEKALQTVAGVQEIRLDAGAITSFPTLVIGPPEIQREKGDAEPTGIRLPVYAVIEAGDRVVELLCLLESDVAQAIDGLTPGVVAGPSVPFPYPQGQTDLPSYQLIYEVGL